MHVNRGIDVVVVGLNVVDVVVKLPLAFQRGEKHLINEMAIHGGGPAGNAACVLAALGWSTAVVAKLGDDALSTIARADFEAHGVRSDLFIEDVRARPAVAVVTVDAQDGCRTVFYSVEGCRPLLAEDIPRDAIANARLVLTDGYEPLAAVEALRIARRAGVPSLVDLEDGAEDQLWTLLELSTNAILPIEAGRRLTDVRDAHEVLTALSQRTLAQVIVTDGERGSWAWTPEGIHHQEAIAVDVVDTTGCGDAYHGAYAAALLEGAPLRDRMRMAAYVASRVAMNTGGRTGLPNRESLDAEGFVARPTDRQTTNEAAS